MRVLSQGDYAQTYRSTREVAQSTIIWIILSDLAAEEPSETKPPRKAHLLKTKCWMIFNIIWFSGRPKTAKSEKKSPNCWLLVCWKLETTKCSLYKMSDVLLHSVYTWRSSPQPVGATIAPTVAATIAPCIRLITISRSRRKSASCTTLHHLHVQGVPIKTVPLFLFCDNFRKCAPILTFFHW